MRARLTTTQTVVIVLSVVALAAGLWFGYVAGRGDGSGETTNTVTYTVPDTATVPVTVHVVGAVRAPGLYTLTAGCRVRDAVKAAGGFSPEADPASVNLAAYIDDGDQVRVEAVPPPEAPAKSITPSCPRPSSSARTTHRRGPSAVHSHARPQPAPSEPPPDPGSSPGNGLPDFAQSPSRGRVRINHADLEELQRIPGVGPETARNIVYHRTINGPFESFNELDDVPGIGSATIEKIRVSATLN
jgi:competence protein ComEA